MTQGEFIGITIPCADAATARAIDAELVERHPTACVQVERVIEVHHRWRGQIETAREVPLVGQARADRLEWVSETFRALHLYKTTEQYRASAAAATVAP